jgi:hypothetical protein
VASVDVMVIVQREYSCVKLGYIIEKLCWARNRRNQMSLNKLPKEIYDR